MAYRFGLLGYPLTYSLSPYIHQVFLEECGFRGEYELIPIAVDEQLAQRLQTILARMRQGEYDGLNVTIPHKQAVKGFLDSLDEEAKAVGAVNTIYRQHPLLVGTNTDVEGFLVDLERGMPLDAGGTALILGAGGAARAVAFGLLSKGWRVLIAARRLAQAQEVVCNLLSHQDVKMERIKALPLSHEMELPPEDWQELRLVVNATPLGTKGLEQGSPLPSKFRCPRNTCFYDLVYNPPETTFLRQARERGCSARNGLGMLIHQAALAFEHWTGCKIAVTPQLEARIMARIWQDEN
ncbi:MAG: shikimate dehydrogenase [Anaerolineales bacterium]|nr:shikimate dehydrogenase [Anaerolineales bacterium]MCS7246859.1 shikimate dehydrogenase [Anaerolineales bacterium]MDW8160669.1 shikimate dehydrogenase [Anaerolineales bacterium]MDW8445853.1 shikimate dehydrogenase [Anaerolineales bacterium]